MNLTWSSQGLVYRYDFDKADDGVGGEEGTFCLCTLWYVASTSRQLVFAFVVVQG